MWKVYILKCSDGSLYTGITSDIDLRIKNHNNGNASKYTRVRRPVKLVYYEFQNTRSDALKRECQIKSFTRPVKDKLIQAGIGEVKEKL